MNEKKGLLNKLLMILVFLSLVLVLLGKGDTDFDYNALDQYIEKAVRDFELVGLAIAVVKDNQVVLCRGYGLEKVDTNEKITANSLFNIASCTKAFTAACLGILVNEGKVKWDDRVIDYLPEFRLSDPYITRELTLKDLLCHRAGLATFDGDLLWYETDYDDMEIIRRLRYIPIKKQFRSEFGYQNNLYLAAGEVIKRITGMDWSEFLTSRILQPLDMTTTRTAGKSLGEDQHTAYPHVGNKIYPRYLRKPHAAASLFSCVTDMSHWLQMLLDQGKWKDQQILEPEILEELFSPQIVVPVSSFDKENGTHFRTYGLGWGVSDYYGEKIVEHSGGMPGYVSKIVLVPDKKLGFVILTNNENSLTNVLRYHILDLFLDHKPKDWAQEFLEKNKRHDTYIQDQEAKRQKERIKRTRPSLKPEDYTGQYEDQMYGTAEIVLQKKQLLLTLLPSREVFTSKMEHWHYDTFKVVFKDEFLPPGYVTFQFDSHGQVTGFTIDLPNPDFHFKNLYFKKLK